MCVRSNYHSLSNYKKLLEAWKEDSRVKRADRSPVEARHETGLMLVVSGIGLCIALVTT
jgi:hypothetical protein